MKVISAKSDAQFKTNTLWLMIRSMYAAKDSKHNRGQLDSDGQVWIFTFYSFTTDQKHLLQERCLAMGVILHPSGRGKG